MLGEIIADLSNWMYTYLLVILLVAAGLFFTIRNPDSRSCGCCGRPSAWWWSGRRRREACPPSRR